MEQVARRARMTLWAMCAVVALLGAGRAVSAHAADSESVWIGRTATVTRAESGPSMRGSLRCVDGFAATDVNDSRRSETFCALFGGNAFYLNNLLQVGSVAAPEYVPGS